MGSLLDAVAARRSYSRVTDEAPTHAELLSLVAVAGRMADHSALRPWRIIELRGAARDRLGEAFVKGAAVRGDEAEKLAHKPLRAPLLLAVVFQHKHSDKVPEWEQLVAAAGVAHTLSLLLDEAGWGVFWRTGTHTRSRAVAHMHELAKHEQLLGWLYVGGVPDDARDGHRILLNPEPYLTVID